MKRAAIKQRKPPKPEHATCGDYGGVNQLTALPCRQRAGWGVKGKKTGPCRDHTPEALQRDEDLKQVVLEYLQDPELTLRQVAEQSGVKPTKMYVWRYTDEEFDKQWLTIMANRDRQRVQIVEDSLFKRAADNKINPAEAIFFLKNRAPERWKDKVTRELTGADGAPLIPIESLRAVLAEDDDDDDL